MTRILRRWLYASEPELVISDQRLNDAVQAERAREYAGDVAYRRRVMQRMREGDKCPPPPLIKREAESGEVVFFRGRWGA